MRLLIGNIQDLVGKFGKSIVLDKKFLNMLRDVYNFRDNPKLINIIEVLYAKDYIKKVYHSSQKNIEKVIKSIVSDASITSSFGKEDVRMVLYSFAIGINILNYEEYISLQHKKPQKSKNTGFVSFVKRLYKTIDYANLMLVALYLAIAIVGLALFYLAEVNGWWMFFCTIILIIADFISVSLCIVYIDGSTTKGRAVGCAFGTIGTLKSCLPFCYIKDDTSILAILLILALVFLWGAGTVTETFAIEKKSKYSWRQVIFNKNYMITTLFMLLVVGSFVFLSPIRANIDNSINQRIKQKHLTIERKLGYKSFCLGKELPYMTKRMANMQRRIGVDSLGTKIDIVTFKDKFYTDSVDIELISYKGKLVKITLNNVNSGMSSSEEIVKLYTNKYGTPESQQRPIYIFENPLSMFIYHWEWDANEHTWSYKNGTIKIYRGDIYGSISISYISSVYSMLEDEERKREDNEIKLKERKEKELEEIERQRYKNELRKEEKMKKDNYNRTQKDI